MVTKMTERWLSVEEIADYLGVSKDTIYAWREKKRSAWAPNRPILEV
jgi:predicted DNA-binding transcriptional regulator AlpA